MGIGRPYGGASGQIIPYAMRSALGAPAVRRLPERPVSNQSGCVFRHTDCHSTLPFFTSEPSAENGTVSVPARGQTFVMCYAVSMSRSSAPTTLAAISGLAGAAVYLASRFGAPGWVFLGLGAVMLLLAHWRQRLGQQFDQKDLCKIP